MKLTFCLAIGLSFATFKAQAAVSERLLTLTLSGLLQEFDNFGDEIAIPFRVTTRDILEEISIHSGQNVRNGVLVVVDSIDDANATRQIVARRSFNDLGGELNVTDLFLIDQGADVRTARYSGNALRSATFYAIDLIQFSTLFESDGITLTFQGFSRENQRVTVQRIGNNRVTVTSSNLTSDGNGELESGNGFIGPVKGNIKIGVPKFFP